MKKIINFPLIVLGGILGLFFLLLVFNYLFYPAFQSYKYDCWISVEEGIERGEILGSFDGNSGEINICINESNPQYKKVLRHEMCHQIYYKLGLSSSCLNPLGVVFEEMTCYFVELL